MGAPIQFDAAANVATLGGHSMVFHCHHYNSTLQRTIEENMGAEAFQVLTVAAQEAARKQLKQLVAPSASPREALSQAAALFAELGFGTLDFSGLGPRGGVVVSPSSHYGMSWLVKFGERKHAACEFPAGYVTAAVIVAFHVEPERVWARETSCVACGAPACRFEVEVL